MEVTSSNNTEFNFFEFLGGQETNLLVLLHNHKNEFDYFSRLDKLFEIAVRPKGTLSGVDSFPFSLFLYIHYHLYFSLSCFLRGHIHDAFFSARKAIDATLYSFLILENPDKKEAQVRKFIEMDKEFKNARFTVQNKIENNEISKLHLCYPYLENLCNNHKTFSSFSAHVDLNALVYHWEKTDDGNKMKYFQLPKTKEEISYWYLSLLHVFSQTCPIFFGFLSENGKVDQKWFNQLVSLTNDIEGEKAKVKP